MYVVNVRGNCSTTGRSDLSVKVMGLYSDTTYESDRFPNTISLKEKYTISGFQSLQMVIRLLVHYEKCVQ